MSKILSPEVRLSDTTVGLLSLTPECIHNLVKKEPIAEIYNVEQTPFARGKFASVRKCTHKITKVEYAAKFIRKRRRSMDQMQDILHEAAVLYLAQKSERIVGLHEIYETPHEMVLVLEMVPDGELQRLVDIQDGIPEQDTRSYMKQILEALAFLHDHNITHLDLKPQNILLTKDNNIKLCDFGISRVVNDVVEVKEIIGTPDYVAPEVLSYEPISLATDMWSVGVLAYVLLSSHSPFAGDNKQETFLNISQCNFSFHEDLFGHISSQAKDFIQSCLVTDPSLRLSVHECLSHAWLSTAPPPSPKPNNFNLSSSSCYICTSNQSCCHQPPTKPQPLLLPDRGILC
ncbi:serine/threonine-protein kinase 17A-like [Diaphorina citri]|uniref:non-specific serine/threonine protein kinase n=1 Tax=Diaphorina citri TaxID=121845 RepID=A0A1S3DUV8_DIACI|nr:serine/threonine-protein kinase 17A-like [Diaphorina citri]KAI5710389.1 hypothetical protein M8J75_008268 [Diaphorina citri]KAI5745994.1 hypothetical protein M8J76_016112 [Diaphorina citri]KAI5751109.1 hypothetical protein M8J77_004260 [Diaphorina citri]